MHRTQLSIEDWQYEKLKALSEQNGRSISELVREILTKHLRGTRSSSVGRLAAIEGLGADPDASGRGHDRFLYGNERES